MRLGIGVDGGASNDSGSMLGELRVAYLLHRVAGGEGEVPWRVVAFALPASDAGDAGKRRLPRFWSQIGAVGTRLPRRSDGVPSFRRWLCWRPARPLGHVVPDPATTYRAAADDDRRPCACFGMGALSGLSHDCLFRRRPTPATNRLIEQAQRILRASTMTGGFEDLSVGSMRLGGGNQLL